MKGFDPAETELGEEITSGHNPRYQSRNYDGVNSAMPDAFTNDHDTSTEIKHEKHRHRLAVFMAIGGATPGDIAAKLGFSPSYVSRILHQPWARARMIDNMREATQGELTKLLTTAGFQSLKNLIVIANDPMTKIEVRAKANQDIVDRWLGKATQPIVHAQAPPQELTEEELDQRINERLTQRSN